jgi:predicted transcriptional regulator
MPERAMLTLRLEPTAARRLARLTHKLSLSKSATVHLALALLAEREQVAEDDGELPGDRDRGHG